MEAGWVSIVELLVGIAGLIVAIVASWDKLVRVPWWAVIGFFVVTAAGVMFTLGGLRLLLLEFGLVSTGPGQTEPVGIAMAVLIIGMGIGALVIPYWFLRDMIGK